MDLALILANIERRLTQLELSADKASRLAGRPDAIRNLRRVVRSGNGRAPRTDTLIALAKVLETDVDQLQRPPQSLTAPARGELERLLQQRALLDRQIAEVLAATDNPELKRKIR